MRSALVLAAALLVAGCSSSTSPAAVAPATTKAPAASAGGTTAPAPTAAPTGGSVDCVALKAAGSALATGGQFLAQLRTQGTVDLIKSGTISFDPQALAGALTTLRGVEGFAVPGLGDPAADLAVFIKANDIAIQIMANTGPVPQSQFDELIAVEGDAGQFIIRQSSIFAALSEACP